MKQANNQAGDQQNKIVMQMPATTEIGIIYKIKATGRYAAAMHHEQSPAFSNYCKIYGRIYIDATLAIPEYFQGKKVVGVFNITDLEQIDTLTNYGATQS